jgi:hypothetical protein
MAPDPREVQGYQPLWTTSKDDYRLVRDQERGTLLIVKITQKYPEAKLFTDDDFGNAVKARMLEAGVPVVTWDEINAIMRSRQGDHEGPKS